MSVYHRGISFVLISALLAGTAVAFADDTKKAEAEFFLKKGIAFQEKHRMAGAGGGNYLENAIDAYKRAVYIDPNYVSVYWRILDCYLVLGDYENYAKTLYTLKKLDTSKPGQAKVLWCLASQIAVQDDIKEAVRLFEQSLQIYADDSQETFGKYRLLAMEYKHKLKNMDGCRTYCTKALALSERLYVKDEIDSLQHFNNRLEIYRDYLEDYRKLKDLFETFLANEKDQEARAKVEQLVIYHRPLWQQFENEPPRLSDEEQLVKDAQEFERQVAAHKYDPLKLYNPPQIILFRYYLGHGDLARGMALYDKTSRSWPFMNNTLVTMPITPDDQDVFRKAFKAAGRWDLFFLQVKSYLDYINDPYSVDLFLAGLNASYREYLSRKVSGGRRPKAVASGKDEWVLALRGQDLQCYCIDVGGMGPADEKTLLLGTDTGTRNTWRIFMKANLPKMPADRIVKARLFLYSRAGSQFDWSSSRDIAAPFVLHALAGPWDGTDATWTERMTVKQWKTPGGDISPEPIYMQNVNYDRNTVHCIYTFDVTALVREWLKGGKNFGMVLKELDETNTFPRQPSRLNTGSGETSPQLVLYMESSNRPSQDNVVKVNGDWKHYYLKGLDALAEGDVRSAKDYWGKARDQVSAHKDVIAGQVQLLQPY